MMDKSFLITTGNQHQYVYSDALCYFLYVPEEMATVMEHMDASLVDRTNYYERKLKFLKEHCFFEKREVTFQTDYSEELVKRNLAGLRQLLIEVTDRCNLECKYCGYGEFYSNYDRRETGDQSFENVKLLVDYLTKLWCSDYNVSHKNEITIGFYGGEPLLNMKLVKETIAYIESLNLPSLIFNYNTTTNAMLLDRYMDYLVEKNFSILISLDGNEVQSAYRVDKHGNSSFSRVVRNVKKLQETCPDYFEKKVNFNSVLRNLNSVAECYYSIKELFGKNPRMAQLNTTGLIPERVEEFSKMFNDRVRSFDEAVQHEDLKYTFIKDGSRSVSYHSMLMRYGGNRYATYLDLFDTGWEDRYIPTGTCRPFERKLFLTVRGKILPCEKIGQEHAIGYLKDGKLNLDCAAVAKYYSSMYEKVVKSCRHCYLKRSCGQCLFLLKEKNGQLICPGIQTDAKLKEEFGIFLTYAENYPNHYEELLSSIVVD